MGQINLVAFIAGLMLAVALLVSLAFVGLEVAFLLKPKKRESQEKAEIGWLDRITKEHLAIATGFAFINSVFVATFVITLLFGAMITEVFPSGPWAITIALLVATGVTTLIVVIFIMDGLVHIPANPPTIAAVTFLGERTGETKREGLRFFPGYPGLYGYIPVEITKRNLDLDGDKAIVVWTQDAVPLKIGVSVAWIPDRNRITNFLNTGGDAGVVDNLTDMIAEQVRSWATTSHSGAGDWRQILAAQKDTGATLMASLVDETTETKKSVHIQELGITIVRLNVKLITPTGKVAEAAELPAIERLRQEAEQIGVQGTRDRIAELVAAGFTQERAAEVVQLRRGEVKKDIKEIQINIPASLESLVKGLLGGQKHITNDKKGE